MRKYLIALVAAVLLIMVPVAAYATTDIAPEEDEEELSGPVAEPSEEVVDDSVEAPQDGDTAEEAEETEESLFAEAKAWIAANFASIVTALTALYAVMPKYGGVAAVLKVVRSASSTVNAIKTYMDDKSNPDSIYNVLARQGDVLSKFMNNVAPILEQVEESLVRIESASTAQERQNAVMLAVEEAVELMANEFSDLISISTTISAKKKAEMEDAFMKAKAHLNATVKEATNVGETEETVA